tara:strand:- start:29 stop:199 length:171 start_codon:yes stop_codon:yes gene_type:complete
MITYKLQNNTATKELDSIIKKENGIQVLSIPFDPDNTDYQAYLEWVDAGNTAEAAD